MLSPGGPIPHNHGEGFDAPPTLERSGSEHRRAVTSLALLERARAWEWVKDPLFARGGQGSRKKTYVMNIEEKKQIRKQNHFVCCNV